MWRSGDSVLGREDHKGRHGVRGLGMLRGRLEDGD